MSYLNQEKRLFGNSKNIFLILLFFMFILLNSVFVIAEDTNNLMNSEEKVILSIRIIDFDSPVKLGDFSEFTYLIESGSEISEGVLLNFWIESEGETVASGSDTIYIKRGEKKETAKIFLPSSIESGVHNLNLKLQYNDYEIRSHRTIEIRVKGTSAIINPDGSLKFYFMISLIGLFILILASVIYLKKKKIKKILIEEQKFVKKYKIQILIFILLLILGILFYFFNLYYYLPEISSFYFIFIGIIILILIIKFVQKRQKKKRKS